MAEMKFGEIEVRDGAWNDPMNGCFYQVIAETEEWRVCVELSNGAVFALPKKGWTKERKVAI